MSVEVWLAPVGQDSGTPGAIDDARHLVIWMRLSDSPAFQVAPSIARNLADLCERAVALSRVLAGLAGVTNVELTVSIDTPFDVTVLADPDAGRLATQLRIVANIVDGIAAS